MRIRDPYGKVGTVTIVLDGLDEVCEHGGLGPESDYARLTGDTTEAHAAVTEWLDGLEQPPHTPRDGKWFIVQLDDGGEVIVGALDATRIDN